MSKICTLVCHIKRPRVRKSIRFVAILSSALVSYQAVAQHAAPVERQGWVFGASVGYGSTILKFPAKQQTDGGVALDAKVGYMVKPHLALLLTTNVSVYDYSGFGRNRKRDFGVVAPAVQYWVSDRFWVLGGAGLGGDNPVFWDLKNPDAAPLETKYYPGLGVVAAVGYEIYQRNSLAIDLKMKITYRNVAMQEGPTNGVTLAVLLGVNLY